MQQIGIDCVEETSYMCIELNHDEVSWTWIVKEYNKDV